MWERVLAGVGYALYLREMGKAGSRRFWKSGCLDHEVPSGAFLAPKSDFVGHECFGCSPGVRATHFNFCSIDHFMLLFCISSVRLSAGQVFLPGIESSHSNSQSLLRTWVIGLWVPSWVWLEGFDNSFLSLRGGLPHSDPRLLYWFRFLAYNFFIG